MPNEEPYVEQIMVAEGDGDHPNVEEVKYENKRDTGGGGGGGTGHFFTYADNRIVGSKNLAPYPYNTSINSYSDKVINGIAFREDVNTKGKILATGTATSDTTFYVGSIYYYDIFVGQGYLLTGCPEGGSTSTYYMEFEQNNNTWRDVGSGVEINIEEETEVGTLCFITIKIKAGTTVNNLGFLPMLRLASDIDEEFAIHVMTNRELQFYYENLKSDMRRLRDSDISKANKVWGADEYGYPTWIDQSEIDAGSVNGYTLDAVMATDSSKANKVWAGDGNGAPGWIDQSEIDAGSVNGHTLGVSIASYGSLNRNVILCSDGTWKWAEDQTVDFTSSDVNTDAAATSWFADVPKMTTSSSLKTLFATLSKIANNVKYLFVKSGGHSLGTDVPSNAVFTDHTYNLFEKNIDANYQTNYRTQTKGNTDSGSYISDIRCNTSNVSGAPIHSAGLAWGISDTHGYLMANYNSAQAFIGGGNQNKLNWVAELAFKTDLNSYQPKLTFTRFQASKTSVAINANSTLSVTCTMDSSTSGYTFLCACGFNTGDRSISCNTFVNDATTLSLNNFYTAKLTVTVRKWSLWYK